MAIDLAIDLAGSIRLVGATAMLRPATIRVDPGGETSFDISVRNTGTIVDEFSFEIRGDPAPWAQVEPAVLRLFPGAEGIVTVRFHPPRTPTTRAGLTPFGVKVISKEDPEGTIVEEGTLEIGEFADNTIEMIPRTSRGSMGASHDIYIDNRGNQRLSTTIDATDPDENLQFRISPPSTTVDAGNATRVRVRAQPKKRFLRGQPKTHPFKVIVQPEGEQALQADGTMLQEPLLPKWLLPALIALAALALLWFLLLKPTIRSEAIDAVPESIPEQTEVDDLKEQLAAQEEAAAAAQAATAKQLAKLQEQIAEAGSAAALAEGGSDQRLAPGNDPAIAIEQATFAVPAKKVLSVTDVVLQNPDGEFGVIRVLRDPDPATIDDEQVLLQSSLENFRDLDYHFVTPLFFTAGQELIVEVRCENSTGGAKNDGCGNVAMLYTGSLAKG
jgi:hypothetical protein